MSNGTWSSTPFVPGITNGSSRDQAFAAWEESMMDDEEV